MKGNARLIVNRLLLVKRDEAVIKKRDRNYHCHRYRQETKWQKKTLQTIEQILTDRILQLLDQRKYDATIRNEERDKRALMKMVERIRR